MKEASKYRYPGVQSFRDTSTDEILFRGRDREKQILFHMVLVERLVVLFAKSGIGKTSLLNAGLMALLRGNNYFPVRVTFTDPKVGPLEAIYKATIEAVNKANIDYKAGESNTLWQFFKSAEFWSSQDLLMTPVLILDQFEELFALHSEEERLIFIDQLADLVRGNVPQSILDTYIEDKRLPYSETPPYIKVIISLREDFLGELEALSPKIPHILNNRFRLLTLNRDQARKAIEEPAQIVSNDIQSKSFVYEPEAVNAMLDFLCRKKKPAERDSNRKYKNGLGIFCWRTVKTETVPADEAEPFQLQLLCEHIESLVQKKSDILKRANKAGGAIVITKEDLGGETGMKHILAGYYKKQIKKSTSLLTRNKAYKLFEKHLISKTDRRISLERGFMIQKAKINNKLLDNLVDSRLLRVEPRVDSYYYEVSHDVLIEPIRKVQRARISIKAISLSGIIILYSLIIGGGFFIQEQIKNGDMALVSGRPGEAIRYFERVIIFKPRDASLAFKLGNAYAAKNNSDKAIKQYQEVIEMDNKYSDAYVALGNVFKQQARYDDAENIYRLAIQNDRLNKNAYKELALLYIKRGDTEKGSALFRDAISVNQQYAFIIFEVMDSMEKMGTEEDIKKVNAIASGNNINDAEYYNILGYHFFKQKKYDRATENYRKAIRLNSRYADAYFNLGLVYFSEKKYNEAESSFEKTIEYDFTPKSDSYYIIGEIYSSQGKYKQAIEQYWKAIHIDDKYINAYYRLGWIYFDIDEDYPNAEMVYKKLYEIASESDSVVANYAEVNLANDHFDTAIGLSDKVMNMTDVSPQTRLTVEFISIASFVFQGKRTESVARLRKFINDYKSLSGEYEKSWSYKGTKSHIEHSVTLTNSDKALLLTLIDILDSKKRTGDLKINKIEMQFFRANQKQG